MIVGPPKGANPRAMTCHRCVGDGDDHDDDDGDGDDHDDDGDDGDSDVVDDDDDGNNYV